jgi:hypothetical protein
MEVTYLDLVGEGYMGNMQWQLGRELGTIPENKKWREEI